MYLIVLLPQRPEMLDSYDEISSDPTMQWSSGWLVISWNFLELIPTWSTASLNWKTHVELGPTVQGNPVTLWISLFRRSLANASLLVQETWLFYRHTELCLFSMLLPCTFLIGPCVSIIFKHPTNDIEINDPSSFSDSCVANCHCLQIQAAINNWRCAPPPPFVSKPAKTPRKTYSVPGLSVDAFYIDTMVWHVDLTGWWLVLGFWRNSLPHTIHVWYICLHLVDFYGKCI